MSSKLNIIQVFSVFELSVANGGENFTGFPNLPLLLLFASIQFGFVFLLAAYI